MRNTDTESLEQISSGTTGRDSQMDEGRECYWQARDQVPCRTTGLYTLSAERDRKT